MQVFSIASNNPTHPHTPSITLIIKSLCNSYTVENVTSILDLKYKRNLQQKFAITQHYSWDRGEQKW